MEKPIEDIKKIYISGAISDCPDFMERFKAAERFLKEVFPDAEIINPALVNGFMPASTTHEEYMKISFVLLDMADTMYMLDNWRTSCGASQELGYGIAKDKHILFEKDFRGIYR